MDTEQFLRRVIAPGNYAILAYNMTPELTAGAKWGARAFAMGDLARMASYAAWCSSKNWDTYAALAAFTMAQPRTGDNSTNQDGTPKLRAERKQNNVQALKTLFVDLDVKRDGDGKNPANVFATRGDALSWLKGFVIAIPGLPGPNLVIDSGYGYHAYWTFDPPLARKEWDVLAGALKQALLQHDFIGDVGITADSARILRPPGTMNYKAGKDSPALAVCVGGGSAADYSVVDLQTALQPFVALQAQARHQNQTGSASVTQVSPLGARPTFMSAAAQPSTNQNAQAALPRGNYEFSEIATKCQQVATSLREQGLNDDRRMWYLGNLTLLHYCIDGANYTHEISKAHPKYTQAETDAMVVQIAREAGKSTALGAPRCASYDTYQRGGRSGGCAGCPHLGRINSPLSLGRPSGDLPPNYRRENGRIERLLVKAETAEWLPLVTGDIYKPILDESATEGFALSFTYELAGGKHMVRVASTDSHHPATFGASMARQGVPLGPNAAKPFGEFTVAWISELRRQHAIRQGTYRPFGWSRDQAGDIAGLAIGGDLYRCDGSVEPITGGDPMLNASYRPKGTLANWRRAAAHFEQPGVWQDLHAIMAISFGAPLLTLVGDVLGMCWNLWSTDTGVGKTSMMRIAQAVWGDPALLSGLTDTPNAVMHMMSGPKVFPRLWDDVRVKPKEETDFTDLVYWITQGREKFRMNSNITIREPGDWSTMVLFSANRSLMDYVVDNSKGTDSGMARLFEVRMPPKTANLLSGVGQDLALVARNHGHAGREFIAYVAQNLQAVQALIDDTDAKLRKAWNAEQGERFYVAGCVAAYVAACIAKDLGLFKFDTGALLIWMGRAFMTLRHARKTTTIGFQNGTLDIEQVLADYTSETSAYRLVTTGASTGGRPSITGIRSLSMPMPGPISYQIINDQQQMLIPTTPFRAWLIAKGHSPSTVISDMKSTWGATIGKRTIGAGIPMVAGGRTDALEIPLRAPALVIYVLPPTTNPSLRGIP